jgi:ankyrin repeat protein
MAASDDSEKAQKHLALLKQQYAKLQDRYYQLEQKYMKSQVVGDGSASENSFVSQLVTMVGKLLEKDTYSDVTIKMSNRSVAAHKIILAARSEAWNPSDPALLDTSEIDFSDLSVTAASTLVKWIYTNSVLAFSNQALVIELLGAANKFKLKELKDKCEEWLIGNVTVRNCISLYQVSEDHQANNLKKYCLQVISDNWNDLETEDFVNLSPALLYEMFKAHSKYPLHLAIQHNREDVVFLFLVENTSQLSEKVNERNSHGDLPLDLALLMHSESIANTLVGNKCDVDTSTKEGKTLLHLSILRGDSFAAEFLIRNGASPLATISHTLETPLHLAASYSPSNALASFSSAIKKAPWPADDMEAITNLLLEYHANPDGQDSDGNTPLHRAIISKNAKVFKALMEHKLNLELRNMNGDTPLWLALERFNLYKSLPDDESDDLKQSFASQLIQRGCNVETVDAVTGNSTLQRAAISGNEVGAIFLLHQGANPNHRNRKGESTLHLAAAGNLPRLAQVLLSSGADPNYQTNTLLSRQNTKVEGSSTSTSRTGSPALPRTKDPVDYPTSPTAITALNALSVISMATTSTTDGITSLPFGSSPNQTTNPFGLSDNEVDEMAPPTRHPGRPTFPKEKYHRVERQKEDFALPFDTCLFGKVESDEVEFVDDPQLFDVMENRGGKTAVHIAIACKHDGVVTVLLGHRGLASSGKLMIPLNVNIQDSLGESPLGLALWTGQFQVARQLLEAGAEVEAANKENLTLLHLALLREQEEAAIFLLDSGANFKKMTPDGSSSLHMAIRHQLSGVVQYLCEHSVDLQHHDNKGNSPLWMALRSKQENVAKCLVEHGCDANSWSPGPTGGMFTLLHRAIVLKDTPTAVFLIKNGADINSPYRLGSSSDDGRVYCAPPIHLACGLGLEAVVHCLVANHSDVNQKDTNGSSPIHIAISTHHSACAAHLLSHPTINLTLKDRNSLTPFACSLKHQDHHSGLAILTKEPEAAEQYDTKGRNFLHNAIRDQDVEAVMFLMSVRVDVNSKVRDHSLSTPLHLAIQTGSELLVRQLLLAGSKVMDINSRSNGVLHMAVEGNFPSILSVLLENRADPDVADTDMNTPLHLAVKLGHIDCVKVLLEESSANLGVTNAMGQNVLHTLAKYAHENAASIFHLILRSIHNFPLNIPDGEGNTALLLAYFNGHTGLCDSLVKAGAHPGIANREGVSIFTAPAPTKQLLFRILDQIKEEPVWLDGQNCSHCMVKFGIATRKHHCRHCGRILCSKCTPTQLPILKFDVQKPVRLCQICGDCLTLGATR